ncbi:MAG TPA: serine/threonine protein kinase, partial [Eubacteriaceae bacterium]|nr:serine/threonine protein kinase [Eubacteriaceae bacterium]
VMDDRLLSILQTMRHEVGAPIYIHSGLRCASHNADVKGSTYSMHLIGKAADISSDIPIARLKSIAKKHNVNGGLGLNYSSFVHLDTGRRRSW